ncbi:hypothetical protein AB1Y20_017416 [Prymnesium parvum]|uniref:Uncharacterized protein n=1 Tax=Prymnesium parvum TaxID=97485 RepID=A0AB34JKE4_PRYPA
MKGAQIHRWLGSIDRGRCPPVAHVGRGSPRACWLPAYMQSKGLHNMEEEVATAGVAEVRVEGAEGTAKESAEALKEVGTVRQGGSATGKVEAGEGTAAEGAWEGMEAKAEEETVEAAGREMEERVEGGVVLVMRVARVAGLVATAASAAMGVEALDPDGCPPPSRAGREGAPTALGALL